MLSLTQKLSQQQKLTPQQLQYLKLLQLTSVALEQRVKEELELNPLLEEGEQPGTDEIAADTHEENEREELDWEEILPQGHDDYERPTRLREDENGEYPQRAEESLSERLLAQLRMQRLTEEDLILAEEIIGTIDSDGYLRRDLQEIVDDLNRFLSETASPTILSDVSADPFTSYDSRRPEQPFGRDRMTAARDDAARDDAARADATHGAATKNGLPHAAHEAIDQDEEEVESVAEIVPEPARVEHRTIADLSLEEMASLPIEELARILERGTTTMPAPQEEVAATSPATQNAGAVPGASIAEEIEPIFSLADAESVLYRIQRLDPPAIGSRDLRECLLIQLEMLDSTTPAHRLAHQVIEQAYHEFTMKHFEKICRRLECSEPELRDAIEIVTSLNPKPGDGYSGILETNYVTPDFVVERSGDDFVIVPNDGFIPSLRINSGYREMLKKGNGKATKVDKDTRQFLRQKMEAAKWFIASIHQRRQTMMKVVQAIVEMQTPFFRKGKEHLRPMIYRDIAEKIGMDISTVCRVVNGKYLQTDFGVFELRYFFSEALETAWGEEVSNKVVKGKIKEMIDAEDKTHPLSDETISEEMRRAGYNIARRTVAKYREQMNIPVARLRRAL